MQQHFPTLEPSYLIKQCQKKETLQITSIKQKTLQIYEKKIDLWIF